MKPFVFVALVLMAPDAHAQWSPVEVEGRVTAELAREGVALEQQGVSVRIFAEPAGTWTILVHRADGSVVASRSGVALSTEPTAAIAEATLIARRLTQPPSSPEPLAAVPVLVSEPSAEQARKLTIAGEVSRGSLQRNVDTLDEPVGRFISIAAAAVTGALLAAWSAGVTEGAPGSIALGLAGGATMIGATAAAVLMTEEHPRSQDVRFAGGMVAFGLSSLGLSYSARPVILEHYRIESGWKAGPLVAGGSAVLGGVAYALSQWSKPGCSAAKQERLLARLDVSTPNEKIDALRAFEQCAADDARARAGQWIWPTVALVGQGAALAVSFMDSRSSIHWLAPGLNAFVIGAMLLAMPHQKTAAKEYLEKLGAAKLPVEVAVSPAQEGIGVALNGRF